MSRKIALRLMASAALTLALAATPAQARGLFGAKPAPAATANHEAALAELDRALDEGRLVDAGRILDMSLASGRRDPGLMLRSGELHLARQRYAEADASFAQAETAPELRARALQGRGVALAQLGRSDQAVGVLREAVKADPNLWRAWNALGVESDRRRDWTGAEEAYAKALAIPAAEAAVYNNRGYSRLLQGRLGEAAADFVAAVDKDPSLAVARSNLRLTLALRGEYAKATAVTDTNDRPAALNNAGFAAVMRGDLASAEQLFKQAIAARGSAYGRAYENLALVGALKGEAGKAANP